MKLYHTHQIETHMLEVTLLFAVRITIDYLGFLGWDSLQACNGSSIAWRKKNYQLLICEKSYQSNATYKEDSNKCNSKLQNTHNSKSSAECNHPVPNQTMKGAEIGT